MSKVFSLRHSPDAGSAGGHIIWMDFAKSMAIVLVVLLHVHCNDPVDRAINGFIMPLFFTLSGYLFSYERNPSFGKFALKRFRQLVVPYLWINLIAWVAWVAVLRHYGSNSGDTAPWHQPLLGALAGIPPLLSHDIPLWSLLSFYVVEIAFYSLRRLRETAVAALAWGGSLALTLICGQAMEWFPLALSPSVCGLGFYALGHLWRRRLPTRVPGVAATAVALAIGAAAIATNGRVEFYLCRYGGDFALFLIGSAAGSVAAVGVARLIARPFACGTPRLIRFISRGTLLICGFHLLSFAALKGVALFGFGISPEELTEGLFRGIAFAFAAMTLTLLPTWIVMKYMRPLVDK